MITLAEIQATGLNLNDHGAIAEHLSQGRVAVDTCSRESFATCTSQAVTANGSNTVNFPAWDIEIADPV